LHVVFSQTINFAVIVFTEAILR